MKPLECTLFLNNRCCSVYSLSSLFAGLKNLADSGKIKIKDIHMSPDFAPKEKYPLSYVVELHTEGKVLAFDVSDGYQDFDFPEVFDKQLENIDYYFKSSYSEEFAAKLKNRDKFRNLAMSYHCSCAGNYFETACIKDAIHRKDAKGFIYSLLLAPRYRKALDYKNFESNVHYHNYNLLLWTRLWDCNQVTKDTILDVYPNLTEAQANEKANQQREMLRATNDERIKTVRMLREHFGDRFTGGLSDNETSRKEAPDLITDDPKICTRAGYLDTLKSNYIHILSKGLHGCVGARYGETFAAGRALITDPFVYEPIGELKEGENYLRYASPEEVLSCATTLINDVDTVHRIEDNNFLYYNKFVRPDVRVLNALKVAFPDRFE